jgi:hypothetical protein
MSLALFLLGLLAPGDSLHWPDPPSSLVDVSVYCQNHPNRFAHYFPPDHLKMPLLRRAPGEDASIDRVASTRCFDGAILASYHEPLLTKPPVDESYRVIWMPSFAPPLVIRLFRNPDGRYFASLKRDVSRGETLSGYFTESVRDVSANDFENARAAADAAGCWAVGNTCHAEKSDLSYLNGGALVVVADGESWLLEGSGRGEHWAVEVHHPRGGPFMNVCRAIVKAAQAEAQLTIGDHVRQWDDTELVRPSP